jgi:hypothetical protein
LAALLPPIAHRYAAPQRRTDPLLTDNKPLHFAKSSIALYSFSEVSFNVDERVKSPFQAEKRRS